VTVARTVIVTGAASGIGRAVAADLAGDHHVVATDANGPALSRVAPPGARGVVADVTDELAIDRLLAEAVEAFGGVDALVHCAGIEEPAEPAIEMSAATFRHTLEVNLTGSFLVAKAVAAHLVARGAPGSIVLLGSILSVVGWGGNAAYTASKGGVLQLGRALAVELAPAGIRVNVIGPGIVATPMSRETLDDPVRGPRVLQRIPAGRAATAADVAAVARFLLSDGSTYVNGAFVPVDGAFLAL
jgi:NAD(P)-dependent dehydrogenase (short-subunit alcohol dehydrogenase family)